MFEQYLRIKEGYPDALLFYSHGRLFMNFFFEDAEVASRELQIALTSRNPNAEAPFPCAASRGMPPKATSASS